MVGGPGPATVCSFSITLGILFGRDSRQEAREGHGPAPAWAHARRGVAAAGCLRFAGRRHSRLPGRTRSRYAAASLAVTLANTNAEAHAKANADPYPAADAPTDAATDNPTNTPTHPSTDAGPDRHASPGSHRTTTLERPDVAAGGSRGRDRGRPLAACRCTAGRGLSSGGGACPAGGGRERRRGLGIAIGYAEPVPVDDGCSAGHPRAGGHGAARHRAHAALSAASSP